MENDDHQIGYLLTRREALGVMGGDGIFNESGGQLRLDLKPSGQGYRGSFNIALQEV